MVVSAALDPAALKEAGFAVGFSFGFKAAFAAFLIIFIFSVSRFQQEARQAASSSSGKQPSFHPAAAAGLPGKGRFHGASFPNWIKTAMSSP
jgi:hypothetical protein